MSKPDVLPINPSWTLTEALDATYRFWGGYGIETRGRRLNYVRHWAGVVGRTRALSELQNLVTVSGGREKAAKKLGIAPSTLVRLEKYFRRLPDVGVGPGLVIDFISPLSSLDRFVVDGAILNTLGRTTSCRVTEYREIPDGGSVLRIEGGAIQDYESLAAVLCEHQCKANVGENGASRIIIEQLEMIQSRFERAEIWFRESDVAEMLSDQASQHVNQKDLVLARTFGQKGIRKAAKLAADKLGLGDILALLVDDD